MALIKIIIIILTTKNQQGSSLFSIITKGLKILFFQLIFASSIFGIISILYPNKTPTIEITIVKIRKTTKKIMQHKSRYKTPSFTFSGHIGNKTMNKTKMINKVKYISGLFVFSVYI